MRKIIALTWLIIVTLLSLMPPSESSQLRVIAWEHTDKIVHFAMYFILTYLWMLTNSSRKKRKDRTILALMISYGILMELLQFLMNVGRSFDFWDILANIIGVLSAYAFFRLGIFKKNRLWNSN